MPANVQQALELSTKTTARIAPERDVVRALADVDLFNIQLPAIEVPSTPKPIVEVYRESFRKTAADPEFTQLGQKISEDFTPMAYQDIESLIQTLAATPQEAIGHTAALMRKQGLQVNE